ncbi:OmpP1/FadL family transporter [Thiomicrorhabdus indica]|uniref:OmpP1/FadL family transporter n=1 Tax=Thiomicrorhabdus indica TaxID=2267253 RepID=UPI00102DCE6C|nr:outer membrane protein transport protein [Thiomicrorhabdus indica]
MKLKNQWFEALLGGCFVLSFLPTALQASGFALIEQSASAQGLSYAGAAANPEDVSIMWFNPAGLTQFENNQMILAGHIVKPVADFTNQDSRIDGIGELYGKGGNGAKTSFVPNFYWKTRYQNLDFGLGVNVPFGSTVEYDDDWVGRYHAVYTSTKTININPAVAFKLNDAVSFGVGLNVQYIDVNLTQKVDFGLAVGQAQQFDGYADLQADGIGYGVNLGFLYELENDGFIGLSYRSQVSHTAKGKADFMTPAFVASTEYADQNISAKVSLPASVSLSGLYPINQKINLLADITWTGWSSFDELRISFDNKPDSVQPEEWEDVIRYSLGVTYQYSPKWIVRSGIALDSTPIPSDELRTPRIPDSNRKWLSFGASYQMKENMRIDMAYSHLRGGTETIYARHADTPTHILHGEVETKVDILSAQLVWNY